MINDAPYAANHYYNLYKVAASIGDNDAKERILKFAQYLGLDKRINRVFVQEGIEKLEEIKTMSEKKIDEVDKKLTIISGLIGKEVETEAERLKKLRHVMVNGFIVVDESDSYEEYTIDSDKNIMRNGSPFTGRLQIRASNGYVYDGELKDGRYNGNGTLSKGNRIIVYKGEWLNGKKHGQGVFTRDDGVIIEAFFVDDAFDNLQDLDIKFPNGDAFQGKVYEYSSSKFGAMSGTMTYADGGVYTGEMNNLTPHGEGVLIMNKNGKTKRHKGTWKNGDLRAFQFGSFTGGLIYGGIVFGLIMWGIYALGRWLFHWGATGAKACWIIGIILFIIFIISTINQSMVGYTQKKAGKKNTTNTKETE